MNNSDGYKEMLDEYRNGFADDWKSKQVTVEDLLSKHGDWLNGDKPKQPTEEQR